MRRKYCIGGVLLVCASLLGAGSARAYNWKTHSQIAEVAVQSLQDPPAAFRSTTSTDPNVVQYIQAINQAVSKLGKLRTGLPNSLPAGGTALVASADPKGDPYPFGKNAQNCFFHADDDFRFFSEFRIQDFRYVPKRNADPCGLLDPDPVDGPVTEQPLRRVMGWQAASVDDHLEDSVMWFRPTNVGLAGWLKEAASKGFEYLAGAIVAPFACLGSWIFGDGCDLDQGFELARKYNPVDYIEGWIPGIGDMRSDNFTGLWHFIHVDSGTNRFNNKRGMWYEGAGPSHPGAWDIAIMAGGDLSGLSLNAYDSTGPDRYGRYDAVGRGVPAWQAHSIGHLEWSPLDNLARYGWDKFRTDGYTSAAGLAWPLHAIGDALEPHHVVATTSWGHRPYEEYVDHFISSKKNKWDPNDESVRFQVLNQAFALWLTFRNGEDIQKYIESLAQFTYDTVRAQGEWQWNDSSSVQWQGFGWATDATAAELVFSGHDDQMIGLLNRAAAAAAALLLVAADHAVDPGPGNVHCSGNCTPPFPAISFGASALPLCAADGNCGNGGASGAGGAPAAGGAASNCRGSVCSAESDCGTNETCRFGCCQEILR